MDDYEAREHLRFLNELREIEREKVSLAESRADVAKLADTMKHRPDVIGERVGWLFDGNYGKGGQIEADKILNQGRRFNKVAALGQIIGVVEYRVKSAGVRRAWKTLTIAEQERLAAAIRKGMGGAGAERDRSKKRAAPKK